MSLPGSHPPANSGAGAGADSGATYMLVRGDARFGPYDTASLREFLALGRAIPADVLQNAATGETSTVSAVLGVPLTPPLVGAPHAPALGIWASPNQTPRCWRPGSFRTFFWWGFATYVAGLAVIAAGIVLMATVGVQQGAASRAAGSSSGLSDEQVAMLVIGIGATVAGAILTAVGTVLALVLLYRMWAQVQDGAAETSPGKAVGFLFIPLFNLYWQFIAYVGLTKSINRRAAALGRPERTSTPLAMTFCILNCVTALPYIGLLAIPALFVIWPMLYWQLCKASDGIAAAAQGA